MKKVRLSYDNSSRRVRPVRRFRCYGLQFAVVPEKVEYWLGGYNPLLDPDDNELAVYVGLNVTEVSTGYRVCRAPNMQTVLIRFNRIAAIGRKKFVATVRAQRRRSGKMSR